MDTTFDVTIQVDADTARALEHPARREAAARYLSFILKDGHGADVLSEAIEDAKRKARTNGFTDNEIDAEIEAWRSDKRP